MSAALIRIAPVEAEQLHRLVTGLRRIVGDDRDAADPAVQRLTPSAYRDDEEAARDFRSATRDDLLDRRAADAEKVLTALAPWAGEAGGLSDQEAFRERDLLVPDAEIDPWLRTLTALRLVLATRLGIDDDDVHDPEDDAFRLYDWLGYRLELMVQAADDIDA